MSWVVAAALIGCAVYARAMNKAASPELHEKVKKIVAEQQELQVIYNTAMSDQTLSLREARSILKAAKTLKDAEEALK
jgi:predicted ATPase with chaperone activity